MFRTDAVFGTGRFADSKAPFAVVQGETTSRVFTLSLALWKERAKIIFIPLKGRKWTIFNNPGMPN